MAQIIYLLLNLSRDKLALVAKICGPVQSRFEKRRRI
jgi:hypothetical protein